ncbi:hypothetical protein HrrHc1_070 [Halorubrum phage Hardycor1]|nr:hypothetical protein HrrHc1_070 [Halorubrum phage Hardycor1]
MSDETHTHRVTGGDHVRTNEGDRPVEYEQGDEITPTERELNAFPDRFEPLSTEADESDESADESDATVGMGDGSETEDEAESDEQDAESEPEPETLDDDTPSVAEVEDADYQDLRTFARSFDDVNGNWGEERLRAELLDRAED